MSVERRDVLTPTLAIAVETSGPADGMPVVLSHGFPYDPRAFDAVVPPLVAAGCRVVVPYLRGYGPTRFRDKATPRSGQQAALGRDLLDLLDGLGIERAVLGGYDWGGRAACIVAALHPERVRGLVTCTGYNIQDIAAAATPAPPAQEHRLWYQYYFHGERGRAGLAADRRGVCKLLWRLWSPSWRFEERIFDRSAASFDNPDFVDVVIQSYRHRFGLVPGDPALDALEGRLTAQPPIAVPTINLHGADDGVSPPAGSRAHASRFSGFYERRELPGIGHNVPQEDPAAFAAAVLDLVRR